MNFNASASASLQFPSAQVKREQENYHFPLYAIPAAQKVGGIQISISQFADGLETPSSGAFNMPPKRQRSTSREPNGNSAKIVKAEHPEDFSNQVKTKLKASTRTGQACDRCKVRKIRCDGLAGGCSPCLQNNTECFTTDRITGRATSRGYTENLEQQNRDLQHRVRELEQRLMHSGNDNKASNGYHDIGALNYEVNRAPAPPPTWNNTPSYAPQVSSTIPSQQQETNMFKAMPIFRTGTINDSYLGVSAPNPNLSPIKGTALSILGMEIDIADFDSEDIDEPDPSVYHPQLYNKSYQSFLQTALNINPRIESEKVDLPPRKDGLTYAEWYFRVFNPFLPLLHKPTFMKTLIRWYDDPTFRPTTAETVLVHMLFAIMFFQYAARNREDVAQQTRFNQLSNMHYHYSLGMFYQLACSHTIQDMQALTMICMHLRNFPKPGASWILAQTTMSAAIEMGLHRSVKRWAPDMTPNPLDVEIRKRTFWCLLAIHTTLSGKLGRPMPFRIEDFDVEIPEPIDDELLSEAGLDTSTPGKCLHNIGLQCYKMIPLCMELHSTIYAVRKDPKSYISTINSLESKLRAWKDNIPAELTKGESGQNEQEGAVFALFPQVWYLEFRLLLRHPSVLMTNDQAFNTESMRICVESSRQMLGVVRQLQRYKSLDTTWCTAAVYVMAITTTLCAQFEKREETSAADLAALREEMDMWLDIMGEVGKMLGSGDRLREAIRRVSDSTLGLMSKGLPSRPNQNSGKVSIEPSKASPQRNNSMGQFSNPNHNYAFEGGASTNGSTSSAYLPTDNHVNHQQTPYPASTQYTPYPENSSTSNLAYNLQENTHAYNNHPTTSATVEGPLLAALTASQAQNHTNPPSAWQRSPTNMGSQAWQQWTSTMTETLEPQDTYSANALMQLGGRELTDDGSGRNGHSGNAMGDLVGTAQAGVNLDHSQNLGVNQLAAQWPHIMFDIGNGAA